MRVGVLNRPRMRLLILVLELSLARLERARERERFVFVLRKGFVFVDIGPPVCVAPWLIEFSMLELVLFLVLYVMVALPQRRSIQRREGNPSAPCKLVTKLLGTNKVSCAVPLRAGVPCTDHR